MEKAFGGEWTKGDRGVPILGIQTSASAAAVSNGQYTPLQVDEIGQLRVAASVSLGANQSVNISQVGGSTTVTGAAGVLSIDNRLLAGQAVATGGTGIQSVNILLGGTSIATGGGGTISINKSLVGGQTVATGNAGVQSFHLSHVGASAAATAGTGILKVGADLFQVGGSATITASAGIQRVQSVSVAETRTLFASGLGKIPQYAIISASAAGTADVIASASNTSYIILAYNLMTNSSCTAQFFSNSTLMSGKIPMPSGGFGKVCPYSPVGWMTASAGNNVKISLSAAAEVTGEIVYIAI